MELAAYERAENEVTLSLDTFAADFEAGRFEVTVAVDNDEVIGMALHHPRYSTWKGVTWYLEDLVVTESGGERWEKPFSMRWSGGSVAMRIVWSGRCWTGMRLPSVFTKGSGRP